MHYCYVYGGKRDLNFHGWLNNFTIERLKKEGCIVETLNNEYKVSDDKSNYRYCNHHRNKK